MILNSFLSPLLKYFHKRSENQHISNPKDGTVPKSFQFTISAFFKQQISTFSDITIYKTAAFHTFLVDYVDELFDSYNLPEVL